MYDPYGRNVFNGLIWSTGRKVAGLTKRFPIRDLAGVPDRLPVLSVYGKLCRKLSISQLRSQFARPIRSQLAYYLAIACASLWRDAFAIASQ